MEFGTDTNEYGNGSINIVIYSDGSRISERVLIYYCVRIFRSHTHFVKTTPISIILEMNEFLLKQSKVSHSSSFLFCSQKGGFHLA